MLKLTQSHQSNRIGAKQVDAIAKTCRESLSFVIALNENCPMVRAFGKLVQRWDKGQKFTFIDINSSSSLAKELVSDLNNSRWSVLLVDGSGKKFYGPEAVPHILTHLPFGKVAAVIYILPGTMWLTRTFYKQFSKHRQRFSRAQRKTA